MLVVLLAAGCGGGSEAATSSAPPPTSSSPEVGPPALKSIDPTFDFGQAVLITPHGFRPAWLVSLVGEPIVWWNQSGKPQSVVFDHQGTHSPVIPPGGSYRYTPPTALSVTYHSGTTPTLTAKVQVTPSAQ